VLQTRKDMVLQLTITTGNFTKPMEW
jgi:hypothetical protein